MDIQQLRCKVNFQALAFVPHIRQLGDALVNRLRNSLGKNGALGTSDLKESTVGAGNFVVLHLRFDKVCHFSLSLSLSLYIYIYIFVGFGNFKQCYTSQFFIFFNVNFDKSTGVIYFLFIPLMLANFQNDQKISNYVIYQNFNFKFFISKLCIKNEFMDRIINNI